LVRFECRVIGQPTPTIKWYRGRNQIDNSPEFQVTATTGSSSSSTTSTMKRCRGRNQIDNTPTSRQLPLPAGLIGCAGSVRYRIPALISEAVRRTGSSFRHRTASCPLAMFKCHKSTRLLLTRCVSQVQNAPKLVFAGVLPWTSIGELTTLPGPSRWLGRGMLSPIFFPLDAFGVSISGFLASLLSALRSPRLTIPPLLVLRINHCRPSSTFCLSQLTKCVT